MTLAFDESDHAGDVVYDLVNRGYIECEPDRVPDLVTGLSSPVFKDLIAKLEQLLYNDKVGWTDWAIAAQVHALLAEEGLVR